MLGPDPVRRYLDLLKRTLLGLPGLENELRIAYLEECRSQGCAPDPLVLRDIRVRRHDAFADAWRRRLEGQAPAGARFIEYCHTMIGLARLDNIEHCLDEIRRTDVEGDVLEAGVWRGGATVFMRGYLAVHDMPDRRVWVADSFAGLPPATHPADVHDFSQQHALAIDRETVADAFRRFGLLDERVCFLEGRFRDTLAVAPIERLSLLRLDGDLFESTLDSLTALYPKLAPGGFVIVDDFHCLPPCRAAVYAYRARHGIDEPIERIDWTGAFWRKRPASTGSQPMTEGEAR